MIRASKPRPARHRRDRAAAAGTAVLDEPSQAPRRRGSGKAG